MAKLPRQPDLERLRELSPPPVVVLPAGTRLFRIYFRGGKYPTLWNALRYFGPTNARFDHHERDENGDAQEQECGVTNIADSALTCIVEVFQGPPRIIHRERNAPWLVAFELDSAVTLLDLMSTFPLRAGASMKLMAGPKSYARNWSRYEVYGEIEGLCFPSSLTNERTYVLNERARHRTFPSTPSFHRALRDPVMLTPLRNVARELGYGLL